MLGPVFTVAEVAARLGKGERWLADRIRAGQVEHLQIGRNIRLTEDQVQALVASMVRPAIQPMPTPPTPVTAEWVVNSWGRRIRRR